jgi:hypothetical protein
MYTMLLEAQGKLNCSFLVYYIDTDKGSKAAITHNVTALPTLLFVKDGEVKARSEGLISKKKLMDIITTSFNLEGSNAKS